MDANQTPLLGGIVDRLAFVKAEIAKLKTEELRLREDLINSGESVIDGLFHRAAISESDGKLSTDWQAIAQHFKPSRQLITAHTTRGEAYTTVRLSARKTS